MSQEFTHSEKPNDKLDVNHIERHPTQHVDMAHNVNGRIQNPLHGLTPKELHSRVSSFVREYQFEDEALFQKAAILAQNPADFENQPSLTEDDKYHLRREITNKWAQPKALYMTVICCSLAAAVQGWDQTGSNGANLSFPDALGIPTSAGSPNAARNEWIVGIINAAPYLTVAVFSAWISDPLNWYLGRRGTLFVCGIFCTLSCIGAGLSQTWPQLFVCRILLGVGMGVKACTSPVFSAEVVPAAIRGGLVMSWQLWTAFGIFMGFCANAAVLNTGKIAWRLQLGSAFLPAIPMIISIFFTCESPRWYLKKGRYDKAFKSFLRLRNSPIQAARELFFVHCQLEEERAITSGRTYVNRVTDLFTVPRIRRATLASFVVMLAQQMCGINIIAFYSSTIFAENGFSNKSALYASIGFGAVNFVFAFPAIYTIDSYGRRFLLLVTFPNMAWTLFAAGGCFYIAQDSKAHLGLVAFFIFLFAAFYSPGEGPVPFTYSAEVFPLTHREMGMAWAVATCLGWSGVLSITFPRMLTVFGPTGAFCFYGGLNLIAFVMIFLFVPETMQRTLEELDYVFAVPTATHASYQVKKSLPYFFKRHVMRNKNAHLEPLYHFDEVQSITKFEKGGH